jgi:acyl carrier protein
MDVDSLLKDMIVQHAAVPFTKESVTDETDLILELALDSIAIVNLIADLEETFRIEVNLRDLDRPILNRYRWLKAYVTAKLEGKPVEWSRSV